jgi:alpha/beta hydrolase fold
MHYIKTPMILIFGIFSLLLVVPVSLTKINSTNGYFVYAQQNQSLNPNVTSPQDLQAKKIHVGDIDIAYRMFGKGEALLLIPGSSMTMDEWEPNVLNRLASNHTVIIFDNRGIGKTTAGNKTWSIEQFANDTAGLLDALKIPHPLMYLAFS